MPLRKVYFTDNGSAKTGLTPTWQYLKKVSDGTDYAQPSFTEIGGGWYKFTIDPTESVVGVIDGGAALSLPSERYVPVEIDVTDFLYDVHLIPVYDEDSDSLTFLVFVLQDGVLLTSGLTLCAVEVFNKVHTSQFSVSSASATNGVFVLVKSSPGLVKNTSYYAKIDVTIDGAVHSSADTYIALE